MTKEEIAEIVSYCEEKKISYKQRLEELGINAWAFYKTLVCTKAGRRQC